MGRVKGHINETEIEWKQVPKGETGSGHVVINNNELIEVHWRRDAQGICIQFPDRTLSFNVAAHESENEETLYNTSERYGTKTWRDLRFKLSGEEHARRNVHTGKNKIQIRSQMPGKVVSILTKEGNAVKKNQPLIILEAMKMENEIISPKDGVIESISVGVNQNIEDGAALILLKDIKE